MSIELLDYGEIFDVNRSLTWEVVEREWGKFLRVRDFWKYPDKIYELAHECQYVRLPPPIYSKLHGNDGVKMLDGRGHFVFLERPLWYNVLSEIIGESLGLTIQNEKTLNMLGINIFKMFDKRFCTYNTHNYAPHRDLMYGDQVSCTWYMNKSPHDGEGTNIYEKTLIDDKRAKLGMYPTTPWTKIEKIDTIESEYNSVVVYDGGIPHGQAIPTDRYFYEYRISLVQFLNYTND